MPLRHIIQTQTVVILSAILGSRPNLQLGGAGRCCLAIDGVFWPAMLPSAWRAPQSNFVVAFIRETCSIHTHFLRKIITSTRSMPVCLYSSSLLILFDHIFRCHKVGPTGHWTRRIAISGCVRYGSISRNHSACHNLGSGFGFPQTYWSLCVLGYYTS